MKKLLMLIVILLAGCNSDDIKNDEPSNTDCYSDNTCDGGVKDAKADASAKGSYDEEDGTWTIELLPLLVIFYILFRDD